MAEQSLWSWFWGTSVFLLLILPALWSKATFLATNTCLSLCWFLSSKKPDLSLVTVSLYRTCKTVPAVTGRLFCSFSLLFGIVRLWLPVAIHPQKSSWAVLGVTEAHLATPPWAAGHCRLGITEGSYCGRKQALGRKLVVSLCGRWENAQWFSSICQTPPHKLGFPCGSGGKESACNAGDLGSIPGLGRSPGEGNSYPLQYSGLENFMDCIVHAVAKSRTWLSNFHFHTNYLIYFPQVCELGIIPLCRWNNQGSDSSLTQVQRAIKLWNQAFNPSLAYSGVSFYFNSFHVNSVRSLSHRSALIYIIQKQHNNSKIARISTVWKYK